MSELIAWLRSIIEGDKAAAEADQDNTVEWAADYVEGTGPSGIIAAEHIRRHDIRDTIARCKAELALLDHVLPKMEEADGAIEGEWGSRSDIAGHFVRTLACGYKNRPGFDPTLVLDPAELAAIFAGAEERRKLPAKPDDMDQMRARLEALKPERDATDTG